MRNEEEFKEALTKDVDLFREILIAMLGIDSLHAERAEAKAHEVLSCMRDEPLQVGIILDEITALLQNRSD